MLQSCDNLTAKLNDIKNLLLFLATKYTDTHEEFEEIERLVEMEGGIIENTINNFIRIGKKEGREEGRVEGKEEGIQLEKEKGKRRIQIIERELKKSGVEEDKIREAIRNAKIEIKDF